MKMSSDEKKKIEKEFKKNSKATEIKIRLATIGSKVHHINLPKGSIVSILQQFINERTSGSFYINGES